MVNVGLGINGLQFFIIVGKILYLNWCYIIFGEVIDVELQWVVEVIFKMVIDGNDWLMDLVVIELIIIF